MEEVRVILVACTACSFVPGAFRSDGRSPDEALGDDAPPASACIRDVDALRFFTCAARTDGTAWCWGDNTYRQLGDDTTTNRSTPVRVAALTNIVQVATASRMAYALDAGGTMWAWGLNDVGQLGDGTTTDHGAPAPVNGLTGVVEIDAGRGHVCARTGVGDVYCWGYNSDQQVGDGMVGTSRLTPYLVLGGAAQVADRVGQEVLFP